MAEREGTTGEGPRGDRGAAHDTGARGLAERAPGGPPASTMAELRDVNEQLLITGLREQELAAALEAERAQLAVILAGIGDAVLVVDEAGTPVRTNTAYARMTGGAEVPLEYGLAMEREMQAKLFASKDAKEGIAAYVEKRVANFKGN